MPRRCFLAVDLPDGPTRTIARACMAFRNAEPAWEGEKWVRPEALHLTVRFIGPVADAALREMLAALGATCAAHACHTLVLDGVRAVPSRGRATMLWATYAGDVHATADLARDIGGTLEESLGLAPDPRTFHPHSTLVRARGHRAVSEPALSAASALIEAGKDADRAVSVRSVTLYESTLGPGGPHYDVLGSLPLSE